MFIILIVVFIHKNKMFKQCLCLCKEQTQKKPKQKKEHEPVQVQKVDHPVLVYWCSRTKEYKQWQQPQWILMGTDAEL
jgi:hypothetical protein